MGWAGERPGECLLHFALRFLSFQQDWETLPADFQEISGAVEASAEICRCFSEPKGLRSRDSLKHFCNAE